MKRIRWIQLGIILFIGINFLLVYIDKDGKVDRVSYVNSWSKSFTTDMKEELIKPAVLTRTSEEPIYFDKSQGVFQEFLVGEGDDVTVGEGLFTYHVHNYYEAEAELLNQIDQVNEEIASIEQAISEIEMYQVPESTFNPDRSVLITEEEISIKLPDTTIDAQLMKEQYLVEKEKELAQKLAEENALENRLGELQSTGDMITYESPYAGKVSQLSSELSDPLLLIESNELQATGELSEGERIQVQEGMAAELQLEEAKALLSGTVDSLSEKPTNLKIAGESNYPFAIALEGAEEIELLPGYHGTVAITLEERNGITAAYEAALVNQSVWKMTAAGHLVKEPVQTGMYQNQQYEITTGAEPNELLAQEPKNQFRSGAAFITPIQWKQLTRDSFNVKETDWGKSFVSGLLSR